MKAATKQTILTILFLFSSVGVGFCADIAKVGVVEFQRLFENSEAGKAIKEEVTTQGKKMEAELKEKGAEIEELKNRLDREALVMSKEMREEKERDFRIKVGDIKTLQKKYEAELQNLQRKLMAGMQSETMTIIEEIGKAGGYLLVLDKRGVLYSPGTIDITDEVIKKYNDQYAKKKKDK